MSLSKEAFVASESAVPVRKYSFPDDYPPSVAGQDFYVRVMNARERGAFESQFTNRRGKPIQSRATEVRERLLIATVCDEHGKLILSADDMEQLGKRDGRIISFAAAAASEANAVTQDDLDSLAKN